MRRKLLIGIFLLVVMVSGLSANDSSKLRCYLSTDIPLYYMDFANTDNPDDFYWGTGIIPSGLNLDFGLVSSGILGFSASAELSFSGESSGNSAFGVGDFFHIDLRIGPEITARTGKHMFTANFSIEFEYWKELKGAETTAVGYDETYDTTVIQTNRTAHRFSFYQFFRYSYLVTDGFGLGPKFEIAERTKGGLMFSVNLNFIYLF